MEHTPLASGILERFLRYAVVDTMSDPHVQDRRPTTPGQMVLLEMLKSELELLGLSDLLFDSKGYLIARVPSNLPKGMAAPTIGSWLMWIRGRCPGEWSPPKGGGVLRWWRYPVESGCCLIRGEESGACQLCWTVLGGDRWHYFAGFG